MKKQEVKYCPICQSKNMGVLTKQNYFCRDCYVEIVITKKKAIYANFNSADGIKVKSIKIG
ncbi:hypothetical protein SAMN05660297_01244 [Natronincola peptidivorans]|uniref:Uncharacterized protein n=1 Tax=Natronincola peptidivorans TaxID=426128 RepID=A0A1I0BGK7_9FIRM|nr:hypothetical protein [Natronincola peptidivorans]SET05646.1 hypothetical protein SAMN05660297_01244 [Natronincola peptidivorans]